MAVYWVLQGDIARVTVSCHGDMLGFAVGES